MQIWPVDYDGAWTLAGAITRASDHESIRKIQQARINAGVQIL